MNTNTAPLRVITLTDGRRVKEVPEVSACRGCMFDLRPPPVCARPDEQSELEGCCATRGTIYQPADPEPVAVAEPVKREPLTDERLSVKVKRELFRFHSQQEWVNKGKSWYANCGVRQGFYLTVDAAGHVVHMGKCFMEATAQGLYPITVYELQTNWSSGDKLIERARAHGIGQQPKGADHA